jgi:hypothetical protein
MSGRQVMRPILLSGLNASALCDGGVFGQQSKGSNAVCCRKRAMVALHKRSSGSGVVALALGGERRRQELFYPDRETQGACNSGRPARRNSLSRRYLTRAEQVRQAQLSSAHIRVLYTYLSALLLGRTILNGAVSW